MKEEPKQRDIGADAEKRKTNRKKGCWTPSPHIESGHYECVDGLPAIGQCIQNEIITIGFLFYP